MSNTLTNFAEKLIEFSNVASEEEVYSTLIKAIDNRLNKSSAKNDCFIVQKIQTEVETRYNLQKNALVNSFIVKDRTLTVPKLVWVMVCLYVFDGDRKKVKKLIGNGLTGQKVYTCHREFKQLSDKRESHKKIKEIYNIIIESYE